MRLQILELPSVVVGEFVEQPFVIVIDGHGEAMTHEFARQLKEGVGAQDVFLMPEPVEIVR